MRVPEINKSKPRMVSLKTGNEFQIVNRDDLLEFTGLAIIVAEWNILFTDGVKGFATINKAYDWAQENI